MMEEVKKFLESPSTVAIFRTESELKSELKHDARLLRLLLVHIPNAVVWFTSDVEKSLVPSADGFWWRF